MTVDIQTDIRVITVPIKIIKWFLIFLILYAYAILTWCYLKSIVSQQTTPSQLTFGDTVKVRAEQVHDSASQVVKETQNVTGYALASDFYQRQTGAAINLFNFQTWATTVSPRIRVVEPFVASSKFIIPHELSPSSLKANLRFSNYFDINYWNKKSGLDALVPWERFIATKPSQMILVIIVRDSTDRVVWDNEEIMENEECHTRLQQFNHAYHQSIQRELNLTVIRQVCFTFGNENLSVKEFNHYIFKQWLPSDVVVWFTCWSGIDRGRMNIADSAYQLSAKPYDMLRRSDQVNNDSNKYMLNGHKPNYTAVSIRTVRPWLKLSHQKHEEPNYARNYLLNCIEKLGGVLNHIYLTQHIYGRPFLAIDLGSYGDMSAKKFIDKETMKLLLEGAVRTVYQNNTSVEEWEESFMTNIERTTDNGYIAAVQATMVEDANCVVMMGGYSRFQYNIMKNYLQKHHTNPCIHRVCYG